MDDKVDPKSEPVTFESLRDRLLAAVQLKLQQQNITEPGGFTMMEGFVLFNLQPKLGGIILGGPALPTVMIVGNATGRVYQFSLKNLLPDVELN